MISLKRRRIRISRWGVVNKVSLSYIHSAKESIYIFSEQLGELEAESYFEVVTAINNNLPNCSYAYNSPNIIQSIDERSLKITSSVPGFFRVTLSSPANPHFPHSLFL